ncbi:AAA family ATPase [Vibrio cholerae]|nr:AAA family ATPase [Vibrio cholerae]
MKLIRFYANKVHDYIDFDINFNHDVNFLIGSNGSGKTTAIKMIKALLTPNISELLDINFENCGVVFSRNGKKKEIYFEKKNRRNNEFSIRYDGDESIFILPEIYHNEKLYHDSESRRENYLEAELFSNHDIVNKIRKLPTPIFLGVDRKNGDKPHLSQRIIRENIMSSTGNRKNLVGGLLGDALIETQLLIQDAYKGIRSLEEKQGGDLRDRILKSSFKFSSSNIFDFESPGRNLSQVSQLLDKKQEINNAIRKIVHTDESLSQDIDNFFNNLERLLYELKTSSDNATLNLNLIINQVQINRISDLVGVIDSYDKKIKDIYKPVNEFLMTVNKFFSDSGKEIAVDPVGRLSIRIENRRNIYNVDCLSSGERQLLIIIANVLFNKYSSPLSSKQSIIIIDEPELSLHMRWQEMFSEIILESNPETQFILATHSPDIVGGLTEKCKMVKKAVEQ